MPHVSTLSGSEFLHTMTPPTLLLHSNKHQLTTTHLPDQVLSQYGYTAYSQGFKQQV
jgi:hypothetical protein